MSIFAGRQFRIRKPKDPKAIAAEEQKKLQEQQKKEGPTEFELLGVHVEIEGNPLTYLADKTSETYRRAAEAIRKSQEKKRKEKARLEAAQEAAEEAFAQSYYGKGKK